MAIPAGALLITWVILGIIVGNVFDLTWMGRAVLLVISPLWFVGAYLIFICLLPITVWLHRRYDSLVLVFLAGMAVVVDILRFRYQIPGVEWFNMVFVWGFAFQMGFSTAASPASTAPRASPTGGWNGTINPPAVGSRHGCSPSPGSLP